MDNSIIKFLFMAADPRDTAHNRIGEEWDRIREVLISSSYRENWELLPPRLSMQPTKLGPCLSACKPHFVHFSGHGQAGKRISEGNHSIKPLEKRSKRSRKIARVPEDVNDFEGIVFEDLHGYAKLVSSDILGKTFKECSSQIVCVVLNACHSLHQAKVIVEHIPFVIGMSREIQDRAAIAFSVGFYTALGNKCSIQEAYEQGCLQIATQEIKGDLTPELKISSRISEFIDKTPPYLKFLFQDEEVKPKKKVYQAVITLEVDEEDIGIVKAIVAHIGKIGKNSEVTILDFEVEVEVEE